MESCPFPVLSLACDPRSSVESACDRDPRRDPRHPGPPTPALNPNNAPQPEQAGSIAVLGPASEPGAPHLGFWGVDRSARQRE